MQAPCLMTATTGVILSSHSIASLRRHMGHVVIGGGGAPAEASRIHISGSAPSGERLRTGSSRRRSLRSAGRRSGHGARR
jgi:hypothetical protein